MGLFNTRLIIPGAYGEVNAEPVNSGVQGLTSIGVVGPANGGPMESPLTFITNEELLNTLGSCDAVDYIRAAWGNNGGTVKFVRVGDTHYFDEVWQDDAGGTATDITDLVTRQYGQSLIFDTGNQDWLYVGAEEKFDSVYFSFVTGLTYGTASARTIKIEYYNGTGWTAATLSSDGTISSSQTLRVSGKISFTEPSDWEPVAAPVTGATATSYYYVRLRPLEGAATVGGTVTMIVDDSNALPAYGFIGSPLTVTGSVTTTNGAGTTLIDSGAGFATSGIEAGDTVTNSTDGSTATVVSVDSATQITTTALTGGYYNDYIKDNAVGYNIGPISHIIDGVTLTGVSVLSATTALISATGANFITNRVAVGDQVINNDEGGGGTDLTPVVVSIISETQIIVNNDATGWTPSTDTLDIQSQTVLKSSGATFQTHGIRPGDIIRIDNDIDGAGAVYDASAIVTSVISETVLITSGIAGGDTSFFEETDSYGYDKTADAYTLSGTTEKAYLEAIEPGTDGRNIAVEISQSGSVITVTLSKGGYEEEYDIDSSASDKLATIVAEINADSELVVAEKVTGVGDDDLPTSQSSTSFTGGSNGTATDNDYALGLAKLLSEEDVGVVFVAADYTDAINAALLSHVAEAASINYQLPRIAVCAKPESETFLRVSPTLRDEASALSYEGRSVYLIQKGTISSITSSTGLTTSRTALAAAVAGRIASVPAAMPLSGRALNVIGLDKRFNRSEKTSLINYGIMVFDQDANGISCVRSVTTSTNSVFSELSVRRAVDVTEVTVRTGLAREFIGKVSVPGILGQVQSYTKNALDGLVASSGSTINTTLRNWRNVYVSFNTNDSTRIDVSYEILPLVPINFIFTSVFVHSGISFEI